MYNNTIIMKSSVKANLKKLQSYSANPKYQESMDELLSLYKTRKIENIRSAEKIADGLSYVGKGSAGAANKAMAALAEYRTDAPATGKINRNHDKKHMKTWIIIGKAQVASQYTYTNTKNC